MTLPRVSWPPTHLNRMDVLSTNIAMWLWHAKSYCITHWSLVVFGPILWKLLFISLIIFLHLIFNICLPLIFCFKPSVTTIYFVFLVAYIFLVASIWKSKLYTWPNLVFFLGYSRLTKNTNLMINHLNNSLTQILFYLMDYLPLLGTKLYDASSIAMD